MKLKKRKLKFAAIFGICWFALLVLLVDGILGDHTAAISHSTNSGSIHLHERITN